MHGRLVIHLQRQRPDLQSGKVVCRILDHVVNLYAIEFVRHGLGFDREYDGHIVFARRYAHVDCVEFGLADAGDALSNVRAQPVHLHAGEMVEKLAIADDG